MQRDKKVSLRTQEIWEDGVRSGIGNRKEGQEERECYNGLIYDREDKEHRNSCFINNFKLILVLSINFPLLCQNHQ